MTPNVASAGADDANVLYYEIFVEIVIKAKLGMKTHTLTVMTMTTMVINHLYRTDQF